jgi:hypothetical protein
MWVRIPLGNVYADIVYYVSTRVYGMSWSSPLSMMSDYRVDDRDSIHGRGKGFFL